VVASCSIRLVWQVAVIDGRRYVDGGVRSSTSLRVPGPGRLDEVYVLAPMASLVPGAVPPPSGWNAASGG
jgi:NTE family protein